LGVGGYINNENKFQFVGNDYQPTTKNIILMAGNNQMEVVLSCAKLGLDSDCPPGYSSLYSHGRSVIFCRLQVKLMK
jgi:hypothetical protein